MGRVDLAELQSALGKRARHLRATKSLAEADERRLIVAAMNMGATQAATAAVLETSQPSVSRIVKTVALNPHLLDESPDEIIDRAEIGEITRKEMLKRLEQFPFTAGQHDPTGGDGYVRGSWDRVSRAVGQGRLTENEYESLVKRLSKR